MLKLSKRYSDHEVILNDLYDRDKDVQIKELIASINSTKVFEMPLSIELLKELRDYLLEEYPIEEE